MAGANPRSDSSMENAEAVEIRTMPRAGRRKRVSTAPSMVQALHKVAVELYTGEFEAIAAGDEDFVTSSCVGTGEHRAILAGYERLQEAGSERAGMRRRSTGQMGAREESVRSVVDWATGEKVGFAADAEGAPDTTHGAATLGTSAPTIGSEASSPINKTTAGTKDSSSKRQLGAVADQPKDQRAPVNAPWPIPEPADFASKARAQGKSWVAVVALVLVAAGMAWWVVVLESEIALVSPLPTTVEREAAAGVAGPGGGPEAPPTAEPQAASATAESPMTGAQGSPPLAGGASGAAAAPIDGSARGDDAASRLGLTARGEGFAEEAVADNPTSAPDSKGISTSAGAARAGETRAGPAKALAPSGPTDRAASGAIAPASGAIAPAAGAVTPAAGAVTPASARRAKRVRERAAERRRKEYAKAFRARKRARLKARAAAKKEGVAAAQARRDGYRSTFIERREQRLAPSPLPTTPVNHVPAGQ